MDAASVAASWDAKNPGTFGFQKGQSGNPTGNGRTCRCQSLAREQTEASIKTLVEIRDNAKAPAAVWRRGRQCAAGSWIGKADSGAQTFFAGEMTARAPSTLVSAGNKPDEWTDKYGGAGSEREPFVTVRAKSE